MGAAASQGPAENRAKRLVLAMAVSALLGVACVTALVLELPSLMASYWDVS